MSKSIKLIASPFHSPVDEACGLLFQLCVPYSDKNVTILVNPNMVDYKEKDGDENIEIKQLTFSLFTKDTKELFFDFNANNVKTIDNGNEKIEVKLMRIDTENIQGQDFMSFELFVSEV